MRKHQENEDQANRLSAFQLFLAFLSNVRFRRPVGRTRRPRDKKATSTHKENLENPPGADLVGDHHDAATGRWAGFKRKVRKLFRRKARSHRDSDEHRKSSMANGGLEIETDVDAEDVSTIPVGLIRESHQERDKASLGCTVSTPTPLTSSLQNLTLEDYDDRDWCQLKDWPRELNHVTESHFVSTPSPTPLISTPQIPQLEILGDQNWCELRDGVMEETIPESRTSTPCQLHRVGKVVFVSEASVDNRGSFIGTDENDSDSTLESGVSLGAENTIISVQGVNLIDNEEPDGSPIDNGDTGYPATESDRSPIDNGDTGYPATESDRSPIDNDDTGYPATESDRSPIDNGDTGYPATEFDSFKLSYDVGIRDDSGDSLGETSLSPRLPDDTDQYLIASYPATEFVNNLRDKVAASWSEEEMEHETAFYPATAISDYYLEGEKEPELSCDKGEKDQDDQCCSRPMNPLGKEHAEFLTGRPATTGSQMTRHPPAISCLTPDTRRHMKDTLYDICTPGLEYSYSWEDKLISCDEIEYVRERDAPAFLPAAINTPYEIECYQTGREKYADDVKLLGSGSYGAAYLAKMRGQSVVIKLFLTGLTSLEAIVKEARMMAHLDGKKCSPRFLGLVRLEDSETFVSCGMVMEYIGDNMVADSNLFDVFWDDCEAHENHKDSHMVIPRQDWLGVCYRLSLAVKKIHEMKIIQNDIKINNVLLRREGRQWVPYVIDFGISFMKSEASSFNVFSERQDHVAPELYAGQTISQKSDIFALGYILDMLSKAFDLHLNDVIRRCMNVVPERRPTADRLSKILLERMRRVSSLNCGLRPQWC